MTITIMIVCHRLSVSHAKCPAPFLLLFKHCPSQKPPLRVHPLRGAGANVRCDWNFNFAHSWPTVAPESSTSAAVVSALQGADVTIRCTVFAYPLNVNYWMKDEAKQRPGQIESGRQKVLNDPYVEYARLIVPINPQAQIRSSVLIRFLPFTASSTNWARRRRLCTSSGCD